MSEPTVLRRVSLLVNAALLIVCCFLVARITHGVFEAFQRAPSDLAGATAATPVSRKPSSWSDRQVILTRNLFNATVFASPKPPPAPEPPPPPPPPKKKVEPTPLRLGLLGTISSTNSEHGWAALWDAESRESLVVEVGDEVRGGLAKVVSIERERVLLNGNGAIRELVLDDDGQYRPPKRPPPKKKKKRRAKKRRRGRRGS